MCRLSGRKSRTFIFCYSHEIDSLSFKEMAHSVDSDSGWEDDVNGLVEMIEEMRMDD